MVRGCPSLIWVAQTHRRVSFLRLDREQDSTRPKTTKIPKLQPFGLKAKCEWELKLFGNKSKPGARGEQNCRAQNLGCGASFLLVPLTSMEKDDVDVNAFYILSFFLPLPDIGTIARVNRSLARQFGDRSHLWQIIYLSRLCSTPELVEHIIPTNGALWHDNRFKAAFTEQMFVQCM